MKNYDEFRSIFGTRRSPCGCIRNKVLLAFWKYRFLIDKDGRATAIRTMQDLYNLAMENMQVHSVRNGSTFKIKGDKVAYNIQSAKFRTPSGGCIDFINPGNIKYLDLEHTDREGKPKLCTMGAGRFLRKLIEEHKPRIPEQVITYLSEEFQRLWEGDVQTQLSGYTLVVDKHFDYIYSSAKLAGEFNSCMNDKNVYSFYNNSVNASAAYLVKNDRIYARCVVFHGVRTSDGKEHNYAERQYAKDQSDLLKTILVSMLYKQGYIDLYKCIGAGCHDVKNIIDAKTGNPLKDPRLQTKCWVRHGEVYSFLDTFKYYYPAKAIIANFEVDGAGTCYDLDHTFKIYEGENPNTDATTS